MAQQNKLRLFIRTLPADPRVAKYGGYDIVPASRVYEIFEEIVRPGALGFAHLKKSRGLWAVQVDADIIQLFKLAAFKGYSYGLLWGVSLAYVPHRWKKRLTWHRTLASAQLDLWDGGPNDPDRVPPRRTSACALFGERCFHDELSESWSQLGPTILSWFGAMGDLGGVLRASSEQGDCYKLHATSPAMVHAFTLARTGKLMEAEQELVALSARIDLDDPAGNLFTALRKVAAGAAAP